jgi:hypothetical protein
MRREVLLRSPKVNPRGIRRVTSRRRESANRLGERKKQPASYTLSGNNSDPFYGFLSFVGKFATF